MVIQGDLAAYGPRMSELYVGDTGGKKPGATACRMSAMERRNPR
jgi:hypothetical protein